MYRTYYVKIFQESSIYRGLHTPVIKLLNTNLTWRVMHLFTELSKHIYCYWNRKTKVSYTT